MTAVREAPVRRRQEFHRLRVAAVDRLTEDAVAVTFEVPEDLREEFAFRPGQSLTLRRGGERRSYSICAAPGAPLRVGVREVAGGTVSSWLVRGVRPGDEIEVAPPTGRFTPTGGAGTSGHHVLVAAGSGITPVLSIAHAVLADPAGSVTLLYGNRRSDTVMFAEELADLKDLHTATFELVHVLSREAREVELHTGRLDPARMRALLATVLDAGSVDHWWLCGPYEMVVGLREVLAEAGVPAERVHTELFFVEDTPPEQARHAEPVPAGATSRVTVVLDGRTTELTLPRDVPVLDAAQRHRPDLPFACKGGVCGTCRARVTAGAVRMRRNFALEQSELDAGFVLTCQSLPVTDALTVDYDA
jgi:ring-1,2-phenylacetyl-CoA epoxidase subunit PaaE